jgi:hypothetical protein
MGRIASLHKVLAIKAKATTASFCRPCTYDNNRNVRSYRQALCPGVNEVASTLPYVSTANSEFRTVEDTEAVGRQALFG